MPPDPPVTGPPAPPGFGLGLDVPGVVTGAVLDVVTPVVVDMPEVLVGLLPSFEPHAAKNRDIAKTALIPTTADDRRRVDRTLVPRPGMSSK